MFYKKGILNAIILVVALVLPQLVWAVGLGEMRVLSKRGEPLRAIIEILDYTDLGGNRISVGLASISDYQTAAVVREGSHLGLRFKLEYQDRRPAVFVSTTTPFDVTYTKFLVQARWKGGGKLLREYVLRFSEPLVVKGDSNSGVIQTGRANQSGTAVGDLTSSNNYPQKSNTPPPLPDIIKNSVSNTSVNNYNQPQSGQVQQQRPPVGYYNQQQVIAPVTSVPLINQYIVKPGETLWLIARQIALQNQVDPGKMVVALHKLNPNSFTDGDISQLKKNSVLRVPTPEQVALIGLKINASASNDKPVAKKTSRGKITTVSNADFAESVRLAKGLRKALSITAKKVGQLQQEFNNFRVEILESHTTLRSIHRETANIEAIAQSNNKKISMLSQNRPQAFNIRSASFEELVSVSIVCLIIIIFVWTIYTLLKAILERVKKQRLLIKNIQTYQNDNLMSSSQNSTQLPPNQPVDKTEFSHSAKTGYNPIGQGVNLASQPANYHQNSNLAMLQPQVMQPQMVQQQGLNPHYVQQEPIQNPSIQSKFVQPSVDNAPHAVIEEDGQQIELAKAYMDLGEKRSAEKLLLTVVNKGTENQKMKAKLMLSQLQLQLQN